MAWLSPAAASKALGVSRRTLRERTGLPDGHPLRVERRILSHNHVEYNVVRVKAKKEPTPFKRKIDSSKKRFLITAAQNATPVHAEFFAALKIAAKHLNAELIVLPIRYKNPTSRWSPSQQNEEIWSDEVQPYLYAARKKLCDNLVLLGDVKAQPTATQPLTGFESLTGRESSIIGHTKLQLKVVPVPAGKTPKIITTTGACTRPNYTDTKAGKIGEFHHSLGAALVEVQGKRFHLRQISAVSDGSFIDLDVEYTPHGARPAAPAKALVMGDTHVRFTDKRVAEATFGPRGIVETLDPEHLVWHDVLDGYAANPHHIGNPFVAIAKKGARMTSVEAEVKDTVAFIDQHTGARKSIIVPSNHDNFLARWVARADWKTDPGNALFYLRTALYMAERTTMTEGGSSTPDPFAYWVGELAKSDVRCLATDESCMIADVEVGMHGHEGPNGSRGSIKNLSRIGTKSVVGHAHSPGIHDGCYQVGTSTPLRLEYTHGPSSWLNAHCAIYANGKRSLIVIVDGAWRLT